MARERGFYSRKEDTSVTASSILNPSSRFLVKLKTSSSIIIFFSNYCVPILNGEPPPRSSGGCIKGRRIRRRW